MESSAEDSDRSRPKGYTSVGATRAEEVDFLASVGWHLKSDPESLGLSGDIVVTDDFVVARYSHGPAVFEYSAPEGPLHDDGVMLHACLRGELTLHSRTGVAHLKPFDVGVVQAGDFTGAECESAVTCMIVSFRGAEAHEHYRLLAGRSSEAHLRILNAATSSLFHGPADDLEPGFVQVQRGLEELAKATAIGSRLYPESREASLRTVYVRGVALIGTVASDADTTVESIARDLQVSRSYLFKAFKDQGSTPSYELRQARVDMAKRHLEGGSSLAEAAASSGFGSVRKLRRALDVRVAS
ncbi:MAG: helix-turn-helix domain-containing protein [Brevibacterium sp.]|uniref:helix-turn-helix domain-containing protein n=1 Tax=Brevibacterium sandarakinum TaxID=629680 RepID=UPI00264C589E|nr:helix-turn-helix domain-containing protein [Brevibacterium sandarakinum]MDN5585061.1 helix-turn-helix domain-containing protein [Brevibacterium sp.]MDN5634169.1 helix-turn-helix domain-containing protein [Brevibacterium sp.]MDN5657460.1 helix-turn-helix domain-containing protein [Brevibacterium sandarakinum]